MPSIVFRIAAAVVAASRRLASADVDELGVGGSTAGAVTVPGAARRRADPWPVGAIASALVRNPGDGPSTGALRAPAWPGSPRLDGEPGRRDACLARSRRRRVGERSTRRAQRRPARPDGVAR